jgi:hypothetical protein
LWKKKNRKKKITKHLQVKVNAHGRCLIACSYFPLPQNESPEYLVPLSVEGWYNPATLDVYLK